MISTFNPQSEIFKKSYVPPTRKEKIENKAKVSLPNDFLEGLPESKRKNKGRRLAMYRLGKEETKHQRVKALHEEFKKSVVSTENKLKQLKHKQSQRMEKIASRQHQRLSTSGN